MSIFRPGAAGLLLLLGACSAPAIRPPAASKVTVTPVAPLRAVKLVPKVATAEAESPASTAASISLSAATQAAMLPAAVVPARRAIVRPTAATKSVTEPVRPRPAAAAAQDTLQISGHVGLTAGRGQQVDAGELADTLVYFQPSGAARAGRIKPGQFDVYTRNRDFSPEAIAIPLGSTVTFVNLDDVRHNVFSVTPGSAFDLGYQGSGEKASHTFTQPGVVLIGCNVHRSMELDMLVVATPYVGKVSADGSFMLRGLPAGRGTLHFWNPRAQPVSQVVTLPMAGPVTRMLLAVRPHMDTQLNTRTAP